MREFIIGPEPWPVQFINLSAIDQTASLGRPLREFILCGPDKNFVEAHARIEGSTVVVSHPDIEAPVAVRYAWSDAPDVNLLGKNNRPASPFRTDDFELPEKHPDRNYWEQN